MNNGKTIFSQIMSNSPEREFKACVDRYKGYYRSRNFTCKNQFLVMSYAQLTNRGSLRDIENCLTALSSRLYHCGISYAVPRNTLAKANEKRDWRIYADFAQVLVKKVRPLYAKDDFRLDLDNMVYAFDSSTISLCLKLCPWAKFHKHKGGIKMHTLLDLRGNLPVSVYLTEASVHDVKALDYLYIEPSAIYLMDKGYVDFYRLFHLIHEKNAFFVTRAKDNMRFDSSEGKYKRKGCDGEHHDPHKHKKVQAAASGGCQDRSLAPCRYGCTYSERYATMAFRGSEGQAGYREICRIQ